MQVRTALAALAALLLLAAVVPQATPSEDDQVAGEGDGDAGPIVAVDREGPGGETAPRPDSSIGAPGAAAPVAEHEDDRDVADEVDAGPDDAGETVDRNDDHEATQGEPQVVYRYDVETRGEVRTDPDDFAQATERILTDARGWTLGGSIGFERAVVDPDLTVVLATPDEVEAVHEVCSRDYSCRVEDEIFINDRNWGEATPAWHESEGDLATYRRYLINHEVGHFLGFGHFECGGAGEPAPVMQQQSVSMGECEPNAWPLDWERSQLAQRLEVTPRN